MVGGGMSVMAISWAWKQQVRTTIKFVLVALANFANDHGESCFPGQLNVSRDDRNEGEGNQVRALRSREGGAY
jgi:hypothetical protein